MRKIYEDNEICVTDLEKDWDFIATIQNKTNDKLLIDFYDTDNSIEIEPHTWLGLLADDEGYFLKNQFETMNFIVSLDEV